MTNDFDGSGPALRAYHDAERWFARLLDADKCDSCRAKFERWLSADSAHARAYRETEQLWRCSEAAARHPEVLEARGRILT